MQHTIRIIGAFLLSIFWFFMLNAQFLQYLPIPEYPYDWRRIMELCSMGVITLWLLIDMDLRTTFLKLYQTFPQWVRIGILLFFALGLISSIEAEFPKYALMQVGIYGLLWFSTLLFAALRIQYGQGFDRWVLGALFTMVAVYGIYLLWTDVTLWFFVNDADLIKSGIFQTLITSPSFGNIRFFANFLSFSIPLMVLPSLLYSHQPRWAKYFYFLVSVIWWYALILNHCQTLWLEWLMIPIVALIWFKSGSFAWLKQQLKAAITGAIVYSILWVLAFLSNPALLAQTPHLKDGDDGRFMLWKHALHMIAQHPLLGAGPLHFAARFNEQLQWAHPHNAILMIGAEWGLPALIILLSLVIFGVICWMRSTKTMTMLTSDRLMYIALTAAFIGVGIDSLLSGFTVMPLSQWSLVILIGWMFGFYYTKNTITTAEVSVIVWKPHVTVMVLMVCCVLLVCQGLFPMILALPQQVNAFYYQICIAQHIKGCTVSPNFWTQGWLEFYPH